MVHSLKAAFRSVKRTLNSMGYSARMALLCAALLAIGATYSIDALVLDDQPIDGVSQPSAWATLITPDPNYKPLM